MQEEGVGVTMPEWLLEGKGGVFCVPRALVLLSHYPFYDAFREVGVGGWGYIIIICMYVWVYMYVSVITYQYSIFCINSIFCID
jgi:hypothetical protein